MDKHRNHVISGKRWQITCARDADGVVRHKKIKHKTDKKAWTLEGCVDDN